MAPAFIVIDHPAGYGATAHLESGGFIRSRPGVTHPDIQFHFLPSQVIDHGRVASKIEAYQVGFICQTPCLCVLWALRNVITPKLRWVYFFFLCLITSSVAIWHPGCTHWQWCSRTQMRYDNSGSRHSDHIVMLMCGFIQSWWLPTTIEEKLRCFGLDKTPCSCWSMSASVAIWCKQAMWTYRKWLIISLTL